MDFFETQCICYSLPCKMITLFCPLKNGFWGKKGKIWPPGQIDPEGTHPPPKHVFGCTERKSTLLRVSIEGTRNKKIINSTRWYNFTHMHTPPPIFGGHHILHVASDCGRNHTCQISSESVIHSKVMEGVTNFKFRSRDPDHTHFRVNLLCIG